MRTLLAMLGAMAAVAPAGARAATASVTTAPSALGATQVVSYVAAPGEANRLTVSYDGQVITALDPGSVTFTDPGATLAGGEGCAVTADGHTARCRLSSSATGPKSVRAELGDGDDTLAVRRQPTATLLWSLTALAGPGDDVVEGGPEDDRLDGGGGADVLRGGTGPDRLTDGDTDADSGPDVLDGGGGDGDLSEDTVSYAGRGHGVEVDLAATAAVNGATGEGDTLLGFESATGGDGDDDIRGRDDAILQRTLRGGPGDDRIRGTRGLDRLDGGSGDDVLDGLGGGHGELEETLVGGAGRDVLRAGPGDNDLAGGSGLDRYVCGGDRDAVAAYRTRELLSGTCERTGTGVPLSAGRRVAARLVRQRVSCLYRAGCSGALRLRERGGRRRLLGRAPVRSDRGGTLRVRVRLNRLGARLARRRGGVLVTVRSSFDGLPGPAWSYRLR